jgi:hypothetical protein
MELDDEVMKDVTMRDVGDGHTGSGVVSPKSKGSNSDGKKDPDSLTSHEADAYQPNSATTEMIANFLIRVAATSNEARDQVGLQLRDVCGLCPPSANVCFCCTHRAWLRDRWSC